MANKKFNFYAPDGTKIPVVAVEIAEDEYGEVTIPVGLDGEAVEYSLAAVGDHQVVSSATMATAQTLAKPDGALGALVQNTGTVALRYRIDGKDPTSTIGFQLGTYRDPVLVAVPGNDLRVIREADGSILQLQWTK